MKLTTELTDGECKALGLPASENLFEFEIPMTRQGATTNDGKPRNDPGIKQGSGFPVMDTTGEIRLGGVYIKPGVGKSGGKNIL